MVAVGAVLVDAAPTPVKEFAVATLGTADKPVLLGGIAVVLAVLAAGLGVVGCRSRAAGVAGAAVLGLVGVAAALTRPAAELVDALPSLVGAVVIAGALLLLLRALRAARRERTRRRVVGLRRTPRSLAPSRHRRARGQPRPSTGGRSSVPRRSSPPVPPSPGVAPSCSAARRAAPGCASRCGSPPPRSPHRRCPPASAPGSSPPTPTSTASTPRSPCRASTSPPGGSRSAGWSTRPSSCRSRTCSTARSSSASSP